MSKTEILLGYVRRFPDKSASEIAKIVRKEKPSLKFSDTLVYDAMTRYSKECSRAGDNLVPLLCETKKAEGMAEQILHDMDNPVSVDFAGLIGGLVFAAEAVGGIGEAITILEIIKKGGSK